MRRWVFFSLGLHVAAAAVALGARAPMAPAPDEPARITVIFGNGPVAPAPAAAAKKPRPAERAELGENISPPAAAAPPSAGAAAPGLRPARPDPTMIPARDGAGNRGPAYPLQAMLRHEQGTVLLRLFIGADGAVTRVETLRSSGVAALDAAAAAALSRWHFLPAERDGRPVASTRDQPVEFRLDTEGG